MHFAIRYHRRVVEFAVGIIVGASVALLLTILIGPSRRGRDRRLFGILAEQELRLDLGRQRALRTHAARRADEDHQQQYDLRTDDDADDELHHVAIVPNGNMLGRASRGARPSGGMADTTDSKSVARKGVRVQIPPRAPR